MAVTRKSAIAAQVEAEREAARRYPQTLARRFSGDEESGNVRRGLTRASDDEAEGTPAERTILEQLRAIRAEQAALREEVERLREALAARGRA